ncbi:MAG: type IV pilus assembly protein PilM, partial [Fimbriimonadaceae bacterium]
MSLFTKKAYVGLDIGHHTLRAVQVERTSVGWRIAKSASAPTPVDTVRDGVVIDATLLGLAIKNLLKSAHIHATSASIAISGGTVVVRPIRLPKMAESALRKSIRFEASRYVPNSVEDSYIEFEIVGEVDATNMDVIIAAAPKELVDSRVDACEQAGLEVEQVEVATFAAYRSIVEANHAYEWADKTIGLVDIGSAVTNIGVVSNGAFSMTRAIPAGGQVLTDALKSYFKLSTEDAESGKSQLDIRGLLNEESVAENPPLRILHTHVDDLVREVRRSINYWQSQQNEAASAKHVDVIVLCGGGSNMPGIAEYFQHKLAIETVAVGVFDNTRFTATQEDSGRGLDMGVAVGLAMGLAPSHVIARDPKPMVVKAPKPATPPKEPKPGKSSKGRTFKVTRPLEVSAEVAEVASTSEGSEVAASMPTPIAEPLTPESTPLVAEAPTLEVATPSLDAYEFTPLAPDFVTPEPPAAVFEAPTAAPDVESKYGPELAALIGGFDDEATADPISPMAVESSSTPKTIDELVQPPSASQRMASRSKAPIEATASIEEIDAPKSEFVELTAADLIAPPFATEADAVPTAAQEATDVTAAAPGVESKYGPELAALIGAFDAQPEPPIETPPAEAVEAPLEAAPTVKKPRFLSAPAIDPTLAETPVPESAVPAAFAGTEGDPDTRSALWSAFGQPSDVQAAKKTAAEKPSKSFFGSGKKPTPKAEGYARPTDAPAPAAESTEAKAKKSLFSRAPKADKPLPQPRSIDASEAPSTLKKAANWLFGGPKQHTKPTGILTPKNGSSANALYEAGKFGARDAEIELLRGSCLE